MPPCVAIDNKHHQITEWMAQIGENKDEHEQRYRRRESTINACLLIFLLPWHERCTMLASCLSPPYHIFVRVDLTIIGPITAKARRYRYRVSILRSTCFSFTFPSHVSSPVDGASNNCTPLRTQTVDTRDALVWPACILSFISEPLAFGGVDTTWLTAHLSIFTPTSISTGGYNHWHSQWFEGPQHKTCLIHLPAASSFDHRWRQHILVFLGARCNCCSQLFELITVYLEYFDEFECTKQGCYTVIRDCMDATPSQAV